MNDAEATGQDQGKQSMFLDNLADMQVKPQCSIGEYQAAQGAFFVAVEEYRRASEDYLQVLQVYQDSVRSGATREQQKVEREKLEEKLRKRDAALKVVLAELMLSKAKGEAIEIPAALDVIPDAGMGPV